MLTLAKIQAYERFDGDIDGHARTRGGGDASGITDADWQLIDRLRQAIHLVVSGRASAGFAAEVEQELRSVTADEPSRQALRALAEQ